MQVPAVKAPWYQSDPVAHFVNNVGFALQDEAAETMFLNFSTLSDPGITARLVGIAKSKGVVALHFEQCLPFDENVPAIRFKVSVEMETETPSERIENMKMTRVRMHPFLAQIRAWLSL